MEAALRSPSSRGIKSWRFLFVTDKYKLEEISRAKGKRLKLPEWSQARVWLPGCGYLCGTRSAGLSGWKTAPFAAIILPLLPARAWIGLLLDPDPKRECTAEI